MLLNFLDIIYWASKFHINCNINGKHGKFHLRETDENLCNTFIRAHNTAHFAGVSNYLVCRSYRRKLFIVLKEDKVYLLQRLSTLHK